MKKTLVLWTAFFAVAVCSALPEVNPQKAWRPVKSGTAQKSVSAMPEFLNKNAIVCGNKQVTLSADGKVSISNTAGEIASINLQYVFQDSATGNVDWINTTAALCKMKKEGNKVTWELWKKHKLHTWKMADQTIEILEDGKLKLSAQVHNPKTDKIKPRNPLASFFVMFPVAGNEGKKMVFNGSAQKLSASMKSVSAWRGTKFDYDLFPDNPAENVIFQSSNILQTTAFIVGKNHRITYVFPKDGSGSILIDLRKSSEQKSDPVNVGAGVDFKSIENIELPWRGKRNLLANSSFEQGFHSWKSHSGFYSAYWDGKWSFVPFEISRDAYHGNNSLFLRGRNLKKQDFRNLQGGINLSSGTLLLNPGKYTMSFYAKKLTGNPIVNVWIHNFHTVNASHYACPHPTGSISVRPTSEWKRYSQTVVVEKATPTVVSVNVGGESTVLLDAIQFEPGTSATEFEFPPAAGTLLTSAEDNFISSKDKVNARLKIFAKPQVRGKVSVRVKNFFGEIVSKTVHNFRTDHNGLSIVKLPFENLGKGLFMVRFDYTLADGSKSFDHSRFTVADFLNNTHRLKNMFSDDYGSIESHYKFIQTLDRWRKVGIGGKTHMNPRKPEIWAKYREYGVEPLHSTVLKWLWKPGTTKNGGFGVLDELKTSGPHYLDTDELLIKDHNVSNNGIADEDYFNRLSKAVEFVARKHNHIKCWAFGGEMRAKYANDWWDKSGTDAKASEVHARYLKAFVDGVRRGNPEATVFQDDPCNMRPDGGIAETAKLLEACNKIGVKFDLIAIHPYRFSPESPDLDSDAQVFLKTIKKHGYGDDFKIMWPEMMHWGPLTIPQWGTVPSTWGHTPKTWCGWTLSYDMAESEKLSAAWRARSWLVALKYSDRLITATSGSQLNNFAMDEYLTPYASQLMSNTLGNILGDSTFKKDIRFAPMVRAYVFEDAQNRPVAAVWCHMENVDNGYTDAPVAEADFGSNLESVIDLMNNKRAFTKGKFKFPVSSYPLFIRGKKGTLKQMINALENAVIISGEGISPIEASANPVDSKTVRVTLNNFLSGRFDGTYNGRKVSIPGSGKLAMDFPLPEKIVRNRVVAEPVAGKLVSAKGTYNYDLKFEAVAAGKVSDDVTFNTIDWNLLPAIKFTRSMNKKETSGNYRVAWNQFGLFIQVEVRDRKFVHIEYPQTAGRWKNDCLQIYFDTMANARFRQFKGYDEDDYDYAIFPNRRGDSSIVWRNRSVEQQLGLATQAPPDMTVAKDIPSSFSNKNGVLTYRVFFPAKYLLPAKMQPGWAMGFGLYAANSDIPEKVSSALNNASDGGGCYNRPHTYPVLLLEK